MNMKRVFCGVAFAVGLAHASGAFDLPKPEGDQVQAARIEAASAERRAWIIGGGIAIAGVAVGVGLALRKGAKQ